MAIPILGEIERLINEHGSAVILKERLALASDQYSALEQKLAASELRTKELESANQRLNSDLEKTTIELQNLKKLTEQSHGSRLEELREKILVLLSQNETLEVEEISSHLNIGTQLATFHLEELKKTAMVNDYFGFDMPTCWGLIHGGRAYLVRHGLLA